jgi:hypothetical protein
MKDLPLSSIRTDGGTQTRAELDADTIESYASAMQDGAEFPPAVVFYDGTDYWLADGFHRLEARKTRGVKSIKCDVRQGTRRDAILFSVGANTSHGLRRTNADKRRAVEMLLDDDKWSTWPQERIAKTCAVSPAFVSKMVHDRASLHGEEMKPVARTVERNGVTYIQNTSNIGKRYEDKTGDEKNAEAAARKEAADAMDPLLAKHQASIALADDDGEEPEEDVAIGNNFTTQPREPKAVNPKSASYIKGLQTTKSIVEEIYQMTRKPWSQVSTIDLKNKIAELRDAVGVL